MNPEVATFTSTTLSGLTVLASLVSTFFLVKGGYQYITSSGKPDALEDAKKTVKNALIGLVMVMAANTLVSVLSNALITPNTPTEVTELALRPIEPAPPAGGLTQVLIEAIGAMLQNIIQSATQPVTDAIVNFLTTTPSLSSNSVIFNFWLVNVGIVNALFALLVAVLGFQFMSATTFGFEELELKQLLPRIGLAFLGANFSIFLIDGIIQLSNTLVNALLNATGGLNELWISNAFSPASISLDQVAFITLIFMILFVILAVVLLLFYITRLIAIALGAVLAPFIFLLWALPKFSDFAEISARTYLVSVFSIFVHVVVIQLAASFLTVPGQVGTNSLISILVGIGLLLTLLKAQAFMMQLMFYNSGRAMIKKMGGQIMNVISAKQAEAVGERASKRAIKIPRKVVAA